MAKTEGQVSIPSSVPPVRGEGESEQIHLRLFGLQRANDSRIGTGTFPFSTGLTVADLWEELRQMTTPDSPMAKLPQDKILALVNGIPIQRLSEWATVLKAGDTVTFMAKAFGG